MKAPRSEAAPLDPRPDGPVPDDDAADTAASLATTDSAAAEGVDLSSLSIAGITRRRVGLLAGALIAAWIVVIFARQAGDTAGAAARVDRMSADNRALAAEVASLEQELQTIEQPAYIAQAARGYRIGGEREVPFTLDPSVPAPGADAPGSAALRLGARDHQMTPLESWLSLLFGSAG